MQKALILGWGISGKGSARLLAGHGWEVCVYDDKQVDCAPYPQCVGTDWVKMLEGVELVVINPAVAMEHPLAKTACSCNIPVIGELELGYRMDKGDRIAITGTNGKTTSTMLLCDILKRAGIDAHAVGNIGTSYCGELADGKLTEHSVAVLEVSSFQLESVQNFRASYAVLLNVTPDHFERHRTMNRYAMTKFRIFAGQTARDYAILNYDDPICRSFADGPRAQVYLFSTSRRVKGCYIYDGRIMFDRTGQDPEQVCLVSDAAIKGEHNLSNILACVCVAKLIGVSDSVIRETLGQFRLPRYRNQWIATVDGKQYFNDSKATNIDSTIQACRTMQGNTALIVGGYDKGISYAGFFQALPEQIVHIIGCGDNVYEMMQFLPSYHAYTFEVAPTLERAVALAAEKDVSNVLFSPTTSSFDRYRGYEERGAHFDRIVGEMQHAQTDRN